MCLEIFEPDIWAMRIIDIPKYSNGNPSQHRDTNSDIIIDICTSYDGKLLLVVRVPLDRARNNDKYFRSLLEFCCNNGYVSNDVTADHLLETCLGKPEQIQTMINGKERSLNHSMMSYGGFLSGISNNVVRIPYHYLREKAHEKHQSSTEHVLL